MNFNPLRLYIKGIDTCFTTEHLRDLIASEAGVNLELSQVYFLPKDPTSGSDLHASLVTFPSKEEADRALQALNGQTWGKNVLTVKNAINKDKPTGHGHTGSFEPVSPHKPSPPVMSNGGRGGGGGGGGCSGSFRPRAPFPNNNRGGRGAFGQNSGGFQRPPFNPTSNLNRPPSQLSRPGSAMQNDGGSFHGSNFPVQQQPQQSAASVHRNPVSAAFNGVADNSARSQTSSSFVSATSTLVNDTQVPPTNFSSQPAPNLPKPTANGVHSATSDEPVLLSNRKIKSRDEAKAPPKKVLTMMDVKWAPLDQSRNTKVKILRAESHLDFVFKLVTPETPESLQSVLNQAASRSSVLKNPIAGELALVSVDNNYQRGVIRQLEERQCSVELLDTCEVIQVGRDGLLVLSEDCLTVPVTCFHGSVTALMENAGDTNCADLFKDMSKDETYEVKPPFKQVENYLDVDVMVDSEEGNKVPFSSYLSELEMGTLAVDGDSWVRTRWLDPCLLTSGDIPAEVTLADQPHCFYVQATPPLNQEYELVNGQWARTENLRLAQNYRPFPRECVCFFTDQWYRANVLHLSEDKQQATVFYVDFGNVDVIPVNKIRPLPQEWATVKGQAVRCCLEGLDVNKPPKSDALTNMMRSLMPEYQKVKLVPKDRERRTRTMVVECKVVVDEDTTVDLYDELAKADLLPPKPVHNVAPSPPRPTSVREPSGAPTPLTAPSSNNGPVSGNFQPPAMRMPVQSPAREPPRPEPESAVTRGNESRSDPTEVLKLKEELRKAQEAICVLESQVNGLQRENAALKNENAALRDNNSAMRTTIRNAGALLSQHN